MTMPAALDRDQNDALTVIAHNEILTNNFGGPWRVPGMRLQQRIETLGGRGLLTTVYIATGVRRWRLTPHGAAVHRAAGCACTSTNRKAA